MKIIVDNGLILLRDFPILISGSVNRYTLECELGPEYEGFTCKAVFERDDISYECLIKDNEVKIPWEVLDKPGYLRIGVYGVSDTIVKPTLYSERIEIKQGAKESEEGITATQTALQKLNNMISTVKALIQNAVNAGINTFNNNADNKEKEVLKEIGATLDSIPADYSETVKNTEKNATDITDLYLTKASAIVETASGSVISINDSANVPPLNIIPYGKGEQRAYEGYQLYNPSTFVTRTQAGVTVTNNNDGSFTISGSGTITGENFHAEYTYSAEEFTKLFKTGDLTIKTDRGTNPYLAFGIYTLEGNGVKTMSTINTVGRIEITDDDITNIENGTYTARAIWYGPDGTDIVAGTIKPMLYQDGDGTWEPFVGNAPSPSMAYPQPIVSAENVEVKVYGKNLLDESTISNNDVSGGFAYHFDEPLLLKGGQTYTVKMYGHTVHPQSFNVYHNNTGIADLFAYPENVFAYAYDTDTLTFTLEEDTYCVIRMWWADNSNIPPLDSVRTQLEVGTVATEYEPYKEPQTLSIPYVLREGDKISYAEGKRVETRYGYYLTEDDIQYIGYMEDADSGNMFYLGYQIMDKLPKPSDDTESVVVMSNMARGIPTSQRGNKDFMSVYNMGGYIYFRDAVSNTLTLEEFKSKAVNLYVEYVLANPIETDLTDEDMAQYEALCMNYPTTTVFNDQGATVEVKYVADTKNYMDKKIAETQALALEN